MSETSSTTSNDLLDFEEELSQFVVRKRFPSEQQEDTRSKDKFQLQHQKVYEYIPLLLHDILKLELHQNQVQVAGKKCPRIFSAFEGAIRFRSIVLTARIIRRLPQKGPYNKYIVDDGTGTIELSIHKRSKDIEAIRHLQEEINAMELHSVAQNKRDLCGSLRRLLSNANEHLDTANLPDGTKIFAQTEPQCFKGQIGLTTYSVYVEKKACRDMEIAFKDELINWYTKKFHKSKDLL